MNFSKSNQAIESLGHQLANKVLGQEHLVNRMLLALLCNGHLLVEGAPGLAKTRAIKSLSTLIDAKFTRIQFTPDLLPADIVGTEIFKMNQGNFEFQAGPIFNQLILVDEINRSPAKVQSALLEAMEERQVSVAGQTRKLDELFLVMATQNPIEQEGTYPLPEAQLDRFLLHVLVDYPDIKTEKKILHLIRDEQTDEHQSDFELDKQVIFKARDEAGQVYMSENVEDYLLRLIDATRNPQNISEKLASWIYYGASPRASLSLDKLSRSNAWLSGRDYTTPEDVSSVFHDVLRHRILLKYEAESEGVSKNQVIDEILNQVIV